MSDKFQQIGHLFTNVDNLIMYMNKMIQIVLILVAIKIVLHFGSLIIDKFFQRQKQSRFGFNARKADTLSELLKSILKYTLYILGMLSILDALGFQTRALLVGAGFGGVAIGLGAQSLIKDVISGFFILFEDQFSVGEYITIDNMSGIVEAIGLRITKIKNLTGDLYIIPNGQILRVTNHSRNSASIMVDLQVGYEVNVDSITKILDKISQSLKQEESNIIDGPKVFGISKLSDDGITIKIIAKVKTGEQGSIELELRKRIKCELEKEKIIFHYNERVVIPNYVNN